MVGGKVTVETTPLGHELPPVGPTHVVGGKVTVETPPLGHEVPPLPFHEVTVTVFAHVLPPPFGVVWQFDTVWVIVVGAGALGHVLPVSLVTVIVPVVHPVTPIKVLA